MTGRGAALLALVLATIPSAGGAENPRLALPATVHDFGRVQPRTELMHQLIITNTGTAPLEIRAIQASCSCVRPAVSALDLAPGARAPLAVGFITSDLSGPFRESLTFTSNDPGHAQVTVEFTGTVFRLIEAIPSFVVLDITPDSWTNGTASVRVVNHGDTPITLSEPMSANSTFAARLSTTRPGWEHALELRATRSLPNANHYGRFTLLTSSPEVPRIEVTAFVPALSALVAAPRSVRLPAGRLTNRLVQPVFIRSTTDHRLVLGKATVDAPGVKVTVEEREPGRLFVVALDFPASFHLPAGRKTELGIPTNHPRFPSLRIPIVQAGFGAGP